MLAAVASLAGSSPAVAQQAACVDHPSFTGLTLVGAAAVDGAILRLNPESGGVGGAWLAARQPVAGGFVADFDFRITPAPGADGLAFVIQNQAADALGVEGGGIGYHEMPNSLAIEIDTFSNFETSDPPENHVEVHSRGALPNTVYPEGRLAGPASLASVQDGALHRVQVVYVPGRLDVFVDDLTAPKLTMPLDLTTLLQLEGGTAFAGFTASTGSVVEGHQIERWRFCAGPASLRVVTQVVNDDGGSLGPEHFTTHVRSGGADVPGSPQPGSAAGSSFALTPGSAYDVAVTAPLTYAISLSGACAFTAQAHTQHVCTVTADDLGAPQRSQLPPPEAGEEVNASPVSGTVRVKVRGSNRFVELEEGRQIPVGSVIDTTKGRVTIEAAGGQRADFYDGIFRLGQGRGARPLTTLKLVERLSCPRGGRASAAAKKKKRRLWGDGSGRFRTEGKHSAATVVGTRWLVEDRCASTLTKVARGRVRVRDFVKRKNVVVRAGRQYVARARRG